MSSNDRSLLHHLILDSIPVAVVTMDYDFTVTSFNNRAEELTGYSATEAIGRLYYEILHRSRCEHGCPIQTAQGKQGVDNGVEQR
ncbi:MAG: PAS domain S-box protein [Desulfobulbaceae bacterium]|nr:PAS domain S-box protein [Desulfobulbaceae bacterium]